MYTIIKNYSKLFSFIIKNGVENPNNLSNNDFKGNELEDLRSLKKAIDDGKIDSEEALIISNSINDIEGKAKEGLTEITNKMLVEGFTAKDENGFNSFKKLIESTSLTNKLPEWSDIKGKITSKLSFLSGYSFDQNNLNGISIKGNIIKIRYDSAGSDDTFKIEINENDGTIKSSEWIEEQGEDIKLDNNSKINPYSINDKISIVENKEKITANLEAQRIINENNEIKRLADLEAQKIVDEEQNKKRVADLANQKVIDEKQDKKRVADLEAQKIIDEKQDKKRLADLAKQKIIDEKQDKKINENNEKIDNLEFDIEEKERQEKQKIEEENKRKVEEELKKQLEEENAKHVNPTPSNKSTPNKVENNKENSKAINWNKAEFSKEGIKLIQEKLGFTKGKGLDGNFGAKTLAKVKEKGINDGMIGLGGLKALGLVDKNNNAINGLTKDMFNSGKLNLGNSKRIKFSEKVKTKEENQKSTIETKEERKSEVKEQVNENDEYNFETSLDLNKYEHALKHLKEGANVPKGYDNEFKIGTYKHILDGKNIEKTITIKKFMGDTYIELDGTGYYNDIDLEVKKGDNINKKLDELVNKYKKQLKEK